MPSWIPLQVNISPRRLIIIDQFCPLQRGVGPVELRNPSSIETSLDPPTSVQQLGAHLRPRLRDHPRLPHHLQPRRSIGSSTCPPVSSLVFSTMNHEPTTDVDFYRWLPGFAFSLVLICYEELRKAISRSDIIQYLSMTQLDQEWHKTSCYKLTGNILELGWTERLSIELG